MRCLGPLFKKSTTPVTIMVIPHSRSNTLRLKMPFVVLASLLLFAVVGVAYTAVISLRVVDYYQTKAKLAYLSHQFRDMQTSMVALKNSESQFKRLFSLSSKKEVFEAMGDDNDGNGSINVEELKKQIDISLKSVSDIRQFLAKQKDVFRVTPRGWPVEGHITSVFGMREHPKYHTEKFHTGIDLAVPTGTQVHATADGIVSYAGWTPGNGNVVVLEHGQGFRTIYAHNSRNVVHVGQTVRRGDYIAAAGATGVATGSHVHYEVWKNGHFVNPAPYGGGEG